MHYLMKPFRWIYCIYAIALFVGIMLLIFPFVILAGFLGRIRGGNMIYRLCVFWSDLWFPLVFIYIKRIYESPYDKKKPYIIISNHISLLDAAVIVKAYRRPVRPLGKAEMSKTPVFGYIYKRAIVTVNRSNAADRVKSVRVLKSLIIRGISVVVFPEGTFNTTGQPLKDLYDGAFRIAIETQTPIKPVLFLDDYDRMKYHHVFTLNPGRCRIVYLNEIPVAGLTTHDTYMLKKKVYEVMSEKLRDYKATWIKGDL